MAVQERWIDACRRSGLHLEAIFPLVGVAFTQCPSQSPCVLVEAHPTHVLVARVRKGQLHKLVCRTLDRITPSEALRVMLTDFLEPDDKELSLLATHPDAKALAGELATACEREIHSLAPPSGNTTPFLPILMACAAQVLTHDSASLPQLPGAEPLPPAMMRPQTWATVGAAACLLLVIGYEGVAQIRLAVLQSEASELSGAKQRSDQNKLRAEQVAKEAASLRAKAEEAKREQARLRAELAFYRSDLGGRGEFVDAVLNGLAQAADEEIVIDQLAETGWFELTINAWAVSQSAGYRFGKEVAQRLDPWRFEVRDIQVRAQPGRSSQPGYSVQFRLVRQIDDTAAQLATGTE